MEKPTIYIVAECGLVRDVYVKASWAADAKVVLCDLDAVEEDAVAYNKDLVKQLPEIVHHVY
jgi:hypothetical protein